MIINREDHPDARLTIDLSGPDGNAFHLLAYARTLSRQLGHDRHRTQAILDEMRTGDYDNLLAVFDACFGDYVTLIT